MNKRILNQETRLRSFFIANLSLFVSSVLVETPDLINHKMRKNTGQLGFLTISLRWIGKQSRKSTTALLMRRLCGLEWNVGSLDCMFPIHFQWWVAYTSKKNCLLKKQTALKSSHYSKWMKIPWTPRRSCYAAKDEQSNVWKIFSYGIYRNCNGHAPPTSLSANK